MRRKILGLLGLAKKSGRLVSGQFMTEKAIKDGKARLVIVSQEASANTKKAFSNMCSFYRVPYYVFGQSEELGHSIGKEFRMSLAVTDEGFAKNMMEKLEMCESMIRR